MEELSGTAYVVLGLIARHGPLTPYELKALAAESVGQFWSLPHAQLYRDPPKLAELGLLREETEEGGRRRRVFHLTEEGRAALAQWLARPAAEHVDLRDPALVKLSFADQTSDEDIAALASAQAEEHRGRLRRYRELLANLNDDSRVTTARRRVLDLGVRYEQVQVEFWSDVAAELTG